MEQSFFCPGRRLSFVLCPCRRFFVSAPLLPMQAAAIWRLAAGLFACAGGFLLAPRGAGVAPVRGGTFFLCRGKERRQRKPLETLPCPFHVRPSWPAPKCRPRTETVVVRDETIPRTTNLSDQAVIHPARTTCSRLSDHIGNPSLEARRQSRRRTLETA